VTPPRPAPLGPCPILVVDDDREMADLLAEILTDEGLSARTATGAREAMWMLDSVAFPLVITDLRMPGGSGMELLASIRAAHPGTEVVMITAFGTIDTAIEAIRQGAYDYITKPFKTGQILAVVRRALEKIGLADEVRRLKAGGAGRFHDMVGASPAMQAVFDYVRRIARSPAGVLITGESGTGKELIARAIHAESGRAGPVVAVNCAAVPETLMEGEFFGVRKGAYTDAREDRKGLFEQAHGGTLFLDEVGEIPLALQSKLLRALQDRVVRRVGDDKEIATQVRIVAATNADLKAAVAEGRFREDLFYRLNVLPIHLPPLRERREDIPLLAETLVARFAKDNGREVTGVDPEALERLCRHPWPGNIRELANVLERAVILAPGPTITAAELPPEVGEAAPAPPGRSATWAPPGGVTLADLERSYILRVLDEADGNRSEAAKRLGIDRKTLYRKLRGYGLSET
jgi:two-component system response regulator HydG